MQSYYGENNRSEFKIPKPIFVGGIILISFLILLAIGTWVCSWFIKSNDVDKIQIGQSLSGDITIRRDGGIWWGPFYTTWQYPKAYSYYFSNNTQQSRDNDAPIVQFSNTGTGELNCQVVYRIDWAEDDLILKLHEIAHGDDTIIEQRVLSTLNTVAQSAASKVTSTDVIKKYDDFYLSIKKAIVHNPELKAMGIDVEDFVLAGKPKFDKKTDDMFAAQKEADLLKQTAEAEKLKLISEKEKAIAQYEKEMAENEGKAKAQMAKEVTDADRQKKLAEIEAEKKVEVAKLEKEQAEIEVQKQKEVARIEAEKLLEVAEIQRKTEAAKLEAVKLQSEQKVAAAEAKKKEIELSGAITEVQQAELEYAYKREQVKWENIGKGIGSIQLPQMLNLGSGSKDGSSMSALENFFNLMCLEKAQKLPDTPVKK